MGDYPFLDLHLDRELQTGYSAGELTLEAVSELLAYFIQNLDGDMEEWLCL